MTKKANSADVVSFDEALAKFRATQERWAHYGAWDTEPRWVFEQLIEGTYAGKPVMVPTSVLGWQLYSGMKGNGLAAAALTRAATRAIEAAKRDTIGVARFVNDRW